jgi:hypothetical protein
LEVDDVTALECYRKAADGEEKYAQRRLGVAYEFGKSGLEVDHAKAFLSTTIRPRTVATRRRRGKGAGVLPATRRPRMVMSRKF